MKTSSKSLFALCFWCTYSYGLLVCPFTSINSSSSNTSSSVCINPSSSLFLPVYDPLSVSSLLLLSPSVSVSVCYQSFHDPKLDNYSTTSNNNNNSQQCFTSLTINWVLCNRSLSVCTKSNPSVISTISTTWQNQSCFYTSHPLYTCLCVTIPTLADFHNAPLSTLQTTDLTIGLEVHNDALSSESMLVYVDCNSDTCLEELCDFQFIAEEPSACLEPGVSTYLPLSGPTKLSDLWASNISSLNACFSSPSYHSICMDDSTQIVHSSSDDDDDCSILFKLQ